MHEKNTWKAYMAAMLFFLSIFMSGCGRAQESPSRTEAEEEAAPWKTEGFAGPGNLAEGQPFRAGRFLPWDQEGAGTEEMGNLDSGVCKELFWRFGREQESGMTESEYVLEIYDTVEDKTVVERFSPEGLGIEDEMGCIVDMDMPDKGRYVFRWAAFRQNEDGMYRQTADSFIFTDLAEDVRIFDFREIFLEKGLGQDKVTESPELDAIDWRCDGKGNVCVIDRQEDGGFGILLFGREGEVLLEEEGASGRQLTEPLRTPEGELIFPIYDEAGKSYHFLWADAERGELRPLAQMEAAYPCIQQMYGMLEDDIYYVSQETAGDKIVRWNIRSGSREEVFDFLTARIGGNYQTLLALRKGEAPVLRLSRFGEGRQRDWLVLLTQETVADEGIVRVACLAGSGGEKVMECAVQASMEFPEFHYEYEDGSAREARDRILAELSRGKGPDLLFVTLEDLRLLEGKGLLLEMGDLIPEKLRKVLLPGAMEIGTIEGSLFGMPAGVRAETLAVAEAVWGEDAWRLEDVIGLMEEGKLQGTLRSPYLMGDYTNPSITVLRLVMYGLEDSFLIDWENRECHFDDERFVRLLELAAEDKSGISAGTDAWLGDGGKNILWGYFTKEADFLDFFAHMEKEGGQIPGFPGEGSCGSYLAADGVLAVNANIARKEAAACFLETLLGEEGQKQKDGQYLSVRRLSPEDYIVKEESGRLVFMGGMNAREVPVFGDGSTALHRAAAFLESCEAAPSVDFRITAIILEELDTMYAEGKPAHTAAGIINRRVQLYLDERN